MGAGGREALRAAQVKRLRWVIAAIPAILTHPAAAQDEGTIPTPLPLVAHFTDSQGRLLVGGGPEAEDIVAILGGPLQAHVVGTFGAVPLLAQGTIAIAVLPREMTGNERAASRRFAGGRTLAIPVMQGLTAYARSDAAGAVDSRALALLKTLLSDQTQAQLAERLGSYAKLTPADLAAARHALDGVAGTQIPDAPAGFRMADRRLSIIGSDTLVTLLPELLAGFAKQHRDIGFNTDLRGSSLAMPALTAGMSLLAPTGREVWEHDIAAFQQVKGYAPTRIRIAYASHGPRSDGKTPPAIYVNVANPLSRLSLRQIRRIFAAGAPGGDIAQWSALGVSTGQWRNAPIHVYGAREDGGFAVAMRQSKLDGLPFSARYRSMPSGKAILKAVAEDPLGIGYATWIGAGETPQGVRVVPLGKSDAGPFVLPTDVQRRGAWPISYFFNIYVDHAPGDRLTPEAKLLLTYLLSDEGQQIIAAHSNEEDGYVPLDPQDLAAERKIVEGL